MEVSYELCTLHLEHKDELHYKDFGTHDQCMLVYQNIPCLPCTPDQEEEELDIEMNSITKYTFLMSH